MIHRSAVRRAFWSVPFVLCILVAAAAAQPPAGTVRAAEVGRRAHRLGGVERDTLTA